MIIEKERIATLLFFKLKYTFDLKPKNTGCLSWVLSTMQWTRGTEDNTSLQVHIVVVGEKVQQKYTVRINQHDVIPLHFLLF